MKTEDKLSIPDKDEELVQALVAKKEEALEELDDLVLSIDKANDFYTLGGYPHLFKVLSSSHDSLRKLAAQAFSTIVQNNPKAQGWAAELKPFETIKSLLLDKNAAVVAKGLLLLSALVTANNQLTAQYVHMGGVKLLVRVLGVAKKPAVQAKSLRLLRYFVTYQGSEKKGAVAESVLSENICPAVLQLVGKSDSVNLRDHAAGILVDLLEAAPSHAKLALLSKDSPTAPVLASRIKELRGVTDVEEKDVIEEELGYLQTAMQILFAKPPEVDEEYMALVKRREEERVAAAEAEAARRRAVAAEEGERYAVEEERRRQLGQNQLLLKGGNAGNGKQ